MFTDEKNLNTGRHRSMFVSIFPNILKNEENPWDWGISVFDRTLDWSTLPFHLCKTYLNVLTITTSLILSKKLIFTITC